MKRLLILALLITLAIPSVNALVCSYESNPYIAQDFTLPIVPDKFQFFETQIYWSCVSNLTDYGCISTIHDGNNVTAPILQVNPDAQDIQGIGRIDTFQSDGRIINPYFRVERNIIRDNVTYFFSVHCSDGVTHETFGSQIVPKYREADAPLTFITVNLENLGFWLVAVGMVSFTLFLLAVSYRKLKRVG